MDVPEPDLYGALQRCLEIPRPEADLNPSQTINQAYIARGTGIPQPDMSLIMRGKREPTLHEIARIEAVCGQRRGWLLVNAGCVDLGECTPEQAIALDPRLPEDARPVVLKMYRAIVEDARRRVQ